MDEKARVRQVLSGNASAFAYFVETYQDMAMSIAYRICGNVQDAEDIVQESYVKAYRNLHAFRSDSKFSSWLYRIVCNTASSFARTKMGSPGAATDLPDYDENLSSDTGRLVEAAETAGMVNETLRRMPPGDALLLTLYYLDDNPVKEIAKITGLNETNVKVKLFRARKLFKELLPKEIINP